jgi:ankyrin repeat protein
MNNIKTFENFNNKDIFTYIKNNDIKSVKNYIDSGYDLNIKNDSGYTALILASKNNKSLTTSILFKYVV